MIDLIKRDNVFNENEPFKPRRNGFDISHIHKSCWDMGKLYPVSCIETIPGDNISTMIQSKMIAESMLKPIYENLVVKFKGFEVAYRNLWEHWRNYYTGGRKQNFTAQEPKVNLNCESNVEGSLFDYLGFPLKSQLKGDVFVSAFPFVAYDFIYFWNFINAELQENIVYNIQDKVGVSSSAFNYCKDELELFVYYLDSFYLTNEDGIPLYCRMLSPTVYPNPIPCTYHSEYGLSDRYSYTATDTSLSVGLVCKNSSGGYESINRKNTQGYVYKGDITNAEYRSLVNIGFLYNVNWQKDYFTSGHLDKQAGTAATFPLTGTVKFGEFAGSEIGQGDMSGTGSVTAVSNLDTLMAQNSLLLSSFSWNDMRLFAQISMLKEGTLLSNKMFEYQSYLKYFFGRSPSNDAIRIPNYIGGCKLNFYTGEVIQTSSTTEDSPLGSYAGKGQMTGKDYIPSYTFNDFAIQMYVMYIMPETTSQSSQGINRMWLRNDRYDYYNPVFANLGLQEIMGQEVYATGSPAYDFAPFGYTGCFNELRYVPDYVTGQLRKKLDIWTLARSYDSQQALNSEYILARPSKRIFSVQQPDTPNFTGVINFKMVAYRNLPELPIPQLIDHRY